MLLVVSRNRRDGSVIPGGGKVLFKDRLVVEIYPVRRRKKADNKE